MDRKEWDFINSELSARACPRCKKSSLILDSWPPTAKRYRVACGTCGAFSDASATWRQAINDFDMYCRGIPPSGEKEVDTNQEPRVLWLRGVRWAVRNVLEVELKGFSEGTIWSIIKNVEDRAKESREWEPGNDSPEGREE